LVLVDLLGLAATSRRIWGAKEECHWRPIAIWVLSPPVHLLSLSLWVLMQKMCTLCSRLMHTICLMKWLKKELFVDNPY
jgi:hypothetical protein